MATDPNVNADPVRANVDSYIIAAERILRDMRYYEGGSLRLNAFRVKDFMDDVIALIDGLERHAP